MVSPSEPDEQKTRASLPSVSDASPDYLEAALSKEGLTLTLKQRLFADAYVANGGQGTQAAIMAGYGESSAHVQAYRNLRIPSVVRAIYVLSTIQLGTHVPAALQTVGKLSRSAKSEYIRYMASKDVMDRVGMLAPKRIDINGSVSVQIDLGE